MQIKTNIVKPDLNQKPIKVFLVCSGLGNIRRGYETEARACFDTFQQIDSIDLWLFKGAGKSAKHEIPLWNLPRQKPLNKQISKVIAWLTKKDPSSYFTEQLSFCISLLPYIYWEKPDVIYFSDESIGDLLWHWRKLTKTNYKLLFKNGGPTSNWHNIVRWDYVQQIAPVHFQSALNIGLSPDRQTLLPPGFDLPSRLTTLEAHERDALRCKLNLPEKRPIVLSVAAIDQSRKRIDYIIRELAALPEPRPYFLCLGQQTEETPEIISLAKKLLGEENFQFRTVPHSEVSGYYKVSNVFVLASLIEGFGLVFVEALSHGLPCIAHNYEVASFVLGQEGYLGDFTQSGSLTRLIAQVLVEPDHLSKRFNRHQTAYKNFSWEVLIPSYTELFYRCKESLPSYQKSIFEAPN
ncbi:glycosyltransferase family 4 protein [Leptolyngbya sp. ST-U4]|uniref:glycosyltransferase family 4 protein n=1 Tax=Leptolyngbya sp. ST-U4 TaxID=2933912 RepID=UPI00329974A0